MNDPSIDRSQALMERTSRRNTFLTAFYDLYTETGETWISRPDIVKRSELSEKDAAEAEDYWAGLALIEVRTMGPDGLIELLPYGIETIEDSIRIAAEAALKEDAPAPIPVATVTMDIFISHATADAPIARNLIDILRSALNLPPERIRCTSVDGYRLPAGSRVDEQLRDEVFASRVFIGLITPNSIGSSFVLFELGARWGANRSLLPLLANGATATNLPGPLTAINALSCASEGQVIQFVENVAAELQMQPNSVTAYLPQVTTLVEASQKIEDTAS